MALAMSIAMSTVWAGRQQRSWIAPAVALILPALLGLCSATELRTPLCWGVNTHGQLPDSLPPSISIACGAYHTCGIGEGGHVWCFGGSYHPVVVPDNVMNLTATTPARQVVAGLDFSCALLEDDSLHCFGPIFEGLMQGYMPGDLGAVQHLSAGAYHVCALHGSSAVHCWGDDPDGRTYGPNKVQSGVLQVAAGELDTCILLDSGTVRCYGTHMCGWTWWTGVPGCIMVDGGAQQIALGSRHGCAVLENNSLVCWGNSRNGQTLVPSGLGPVMQTALGDTYTCALDQFQMLTCWGPPPDNCGRQPPCTNPRYVEAQQKLSQGWQLLQMSAGWDHVCVLLGDAPNTTISTTTASNTPTSSTSSSTSTSTTTASTSTRTSSTTWTTSHSTSSSRTSTTTSSTSTSSTSRSTSNTRTSSTTWTSSTSKRSSSNSSSIATRAPPTNTSTTTTITLSSTPSTTPSTTTSINLAIENTTSAPGTSDDIDPDVANLALAGVSLAVAVGGVASGAATASSGTPAASASRPGTLDSSPESGLDGEGRHAESEAHEGKQEDNGDVQEQRLVEARSVLGLKAIRRSHSNVVVSPAECLLQQTLRSLLRLLLGELVAPPGYSGNLRIRRNHGLQSMGAYLLPTAAHTLLGCGCRGREFKRSHPGLWENADGGWAVRLSTKCLLLWDMGHLERLVAKKTLMDKLLGFLPQLTPLISGLVAQSLSSEDIVPLLQLIIFTPLALLLSQAARCGAHKACIRWALGCLQWLRRLTDLLILSFILASVWNAEDVVLKVLTATAVAMTILDLATLGLRSLQATCPACAKRCAAAFAKVGFFLRACHSLTYSSILLVPYVMHGSRAGFVVAVAIVSHVMENIVGNYKHDFEGPEEIEMETKDAKYAGITLDEKDWKRLEKELQSGSTNNTSSNTVRADGEFLSGYCRRRQFVVPKWLKEEIAALPNILDMLRFLDNAKDYVRMVNDVACLNEEGLDFLGKSRTLSRQQLEADRPLAMELTLQEFNSGRNPATIQAQGHGFETTSAFLSRHVQTPRAGPLPELLDWALTVARQLHFEDVPACFATVKAGIQVVVRCFDQENNNYQYAMDFRTINNIQRALSLILANAVGAGGRRPKMLVQHYLPWVPHTPRLQGTGPGQEPRLPPPPAGPPPPQPPPAAAAAQAAAPAPAPAPAPAAAPATAAAPPAPAPAPAPMHVPMVAVNGYVPAVLVPVPLAVVSSQAPPPSGLPAASVSAGARGRGPLQAAIQTDSFEI